ncbi:hypothetical protein [Desulfovibrio desulfuricans]|uniref:hypothetical protein n=1 Tax=Desulfovibrio desulfuricans TaxID=876 RepID=UPI0003B43410|nr:hypothetical protein [Desulfovibrio desulfuricans]
MARKSAVLNDTQRKAKSGKKAPVVVPDIKDLKVSDLKMKGDSRSYTYSLGALSVLDAVKMELKDTGETLNSFVSEAIIYYSNSRFSEEVLGSVVAAHNSKPMRTPERNRILALERLITVIGMDFLEKNKQSEFNRMKKFLKNNPEIIEKGTPGGRCKKASQETGIFKDDDAMPLWLILLYAKKFEFI